MDLYRLINSTAAWRSTVSNGALGSAGVSSFSAPCSALSEYVVCFSKRSSFSLLIVAAVARHRARLQFIKRLLPPPATLQAASATSPGYDALHLPRLAVSPVPSRRTAWLCLLPVFVALSGLQCHSPFFEVAEGGAASGAPLAIDAAHAFDEGKTPGGDRITGGALAGKVLEFVSNVVGDVGAEVKNSVLYGMSKLRNSLKYKKAKYLLRAPDVSTEAVNASLQRAGTESLRFLQIYVYMAPEARPTLLKAAFEELPQMARFRRKYSHLREVPDVDRCYKSLLALKLMLEGTIEKAAVHARLQAQRAVGNPSAHVAPLGSSAQAANTQRLGEAEPRPGVDDSAVGMGEESDFKRAEQLTQLVVKLLPRLYFYYVHPFSNWSRLATDLSLYLHKMLPAFKQVFGLAWRLTSVLPSGVALETKRMLTDYLNDLVDFEDGLRAATEIARAYPGGYDPTADYHYIPLPHSRVLETAPLSDFL